MPSLSGRIPCSRCWSGPSSPPARLFFLQSFKSIQYRNLVAYYAQGLFLPCDVRDVGEHFDPVLFDSGALSHGGVLLARVSLKPWFGRPPSYRWGSNALGTRLRRGIYRNPSPRLTIIWRRRGEFTPPPDRLEAQGFGGAIERFPTRGKAIGEKTMAGADGRLTPLAFAR